MLNPAETFGDIIVDHSYVECSSACITALAAFHSEYPGIVHLCMHATHLHVLLLDILGPCP